MMKQESGKGMIKAFILLVIMIGIIVSICISINKNIKTQKVDNVVSNMLTIKAKCKVFNENRIRTNKGEGELIGTKLADVGKKEEQQNQDSSENTENNENTETNETNENKEEKNEKKEDNKEDEFTTIIDEFKKLGVITEEEYAKYYVLTDKNLEDLKTNVKNEKQSYYLINYETNEVIITKGYEQKYKLSEIEKIVEDTEKKKEDNVVESTEDKEEKDENKEEQNDEENKE